jgi:hypothetical protein
MFQDDPTGSFSTRLAGMWLTGMSVNLALSVVDICTLDNWVGGRKSKSY